MNRKHIGSREPGSPMAYRKDGCRCYPCSQGYAAERARRSPDNFVDAQIIRDHLDHLSAHGIGIERCADLAGVDCGGLHRIRNGNINRKPNKRVRKETAAKVLAVRPGLDTVADGGYIDSAGTYRRLRALVAAGFSTAYLARRLGARDDRSLSIVTQTPTVRGAHARAVRDLYNDLANIPIDEIAQRCGLRACAITSARRRAAAYGWALPAEWDDDTIDDPAAQPTYSRRVALLDSRSVTEGEIEDVRWILRTYAVDLGTKAGRDSVASRLGMTEDRIEYIYTKKIRNAERTAQASRAEIGAAA